MFGFGKVDGMNKHEYRDRVEHYLSAQIGIETNSSINPAFPGVLVFSSLIDNCFSGKFTAEEAAAYIAVAYWRGCAKAGGSNLEEARRIDGAMQSFIRQGGMSGKISEQRGRAFVMDRDEYDYLMR